MYGLTRPEQAVQFAQAVCDVIGHGSGHAVALLLETACQETHIGTAIDRTPYGAGIGLTQIDRIAFDDIKRRTPVRVFNAISTHLGVWIPAVEHRELAQSPLLAFIFCRLHYRLRSEPIPATLEARADYWKEFYNTSAGRGTAEEYVHNWCRIGAPLMEGMA